MVALHGRRQADRLSSDRPPHQLTTLEETAAHPLPERTHLPMSPARPRDPASPSLRRQCPVPDDDRSRRRPGPHRLPHRGATIRELEGALIRVDALCVVDRRPADPPLVEQVLAGPAARARRSYAISAQRILAATAEHFGLTVDDLRSPRRDARSRTAPPDRDVPVPRTGPVSSLPKIGDLFNRLITSTVIHAGKKIAGQMSDRRVVHDHVREITARVRRECDS